MIVTYVDMESPYKSIESSHLIYFSSVGISLLKTNTRDSILEKSVSFLPITRLSATKMYQIVTKLISHPREPRYA